MNKNNNASNEAGAEVDGCWQAESTLQNKSLDYTPLSNLIQANIDGQRAASNCLEAMRDHFADPDSLYLAVKALLPASDIEALTRLRGFMRICQKAIERA